MVENLRWIILAVGLFVVILIYLFGKNKDKSRQSDIQEPSSADEMPAISTQDEVVIELSTDEIVTSEINHFDLDQELIEKVSASVDDVLPDVMTAGSVLKSQNRNKPEEVESGAQIEDGIEDKTEVVADKYQDDLIVIHVQAKSAYFNGTDLLKVINQQQLKFGDMNIYHAYDDSNTITFSMSNMVQPGHFEPDNISEMRTPGVILFMQLSLVNEPDVAFERMNHCAETLARELDGKVTMPNQQKLTEQDVENFREKAAYFKKSV